MWCVVCNTDRDVVLRTMIMTIMMRVRLTLMISLMMTMNIFCHTSSQGLEILRTLMPDPAP